MAKIEPGRDPEMVQRTNRLNLVFAVSSLALLLVLSLMIWVDYDREWKDWQTRFNDLDVQVTRKQAEEALGKMDAARRQQIEAQLAQGQQEVQQRRAEIKQLQGQLDDLEGDWYRADQDFRFTKAKIDVARYEFDEAGQHKHGVEKAKAELDRLEKLWQDQRLKKEEVEGKQRALREQIAALEKTKIEAEKAHAELFGEKTRLDERVDKLRRGWKFVTRNMPVLDMLNPSLKVQQIMPANLYDDVIFTGTPKVDRCTTCHLGIDKKAFAGEKQPFTTHPNLELYLQGPHPIEKIGCTSCHMGRGRATSFQKAAHSPTTKEQEKAWGRYTHSAEYEQVHHWDTPMTTKGHTESQCAKCHKGVVEVPQAARLNLGVQLIERYGCFGCHKIKGWENLRKVGPDLSKIASKTNEEWIYRWIKEPRGFRPTRMPQVWDVRLDESADLKKRNDVEANVVVAYIASQSQRLTYPAPPAGDVEAGRKLVDSIGCLACHRVGDDRRGIQGPLHANFRAHGPNLDGSGTKLDPGWLYAWVRNPKGYWHDTKMPNLRLSEKEGADITAYLMSLKNDGFMSRPRPALDAKLRDDIIREYLLEQNPTRDAEAKLAAMDDAARTKFLGEKTIARYGCFGCHNIPGFEKASPIGVELTEEGSKLVERLDFGFEHDLPHTLPAWVHLKVREPRVYDRGKEKKPGELLRMPKFHVSEDEADAIVTAVLSFTKEQIPAAAQKVLSPEERQAEDGRRLVRDLNCQGCHQIGAAGGTIQQVIADNLEKAGGDAFQAPALSAPLLYNAKAKVGEGSRVHTAWLHDFLHDPGNKVRPWLDLRMPTFGFTEEQLNVLTRYFAAQDHVPYPYAPQPEADPLTVAAGKELFERWQCIKCHVVAGKLPQQDVANMAPDLANVPARLRPDWLTRWLKGPGQVQPGTRMPSVFPDKAEENAFPDILGGDQARQVEAVRAYLLTLGQGKTAAGAPAIMVRDPRAAEQGAAAAPAGGAASGGTH